MKAIATLNKVSYCYPNAREFALKDIDLTLYQGEFLGIIGATGAGKTTLSLIFNGIVPQFTAEVFWVATVAGMDTLETPVSQLSRRVGMVFEDPEVQLTGTSVENEIAFALENLCVPRAEIIARIPPVLAAVRLKGYEKKAPGELSGGQKQRLAIAAALALQPDLLILDEPTSQLDPVGTQEVFSTIQALNRERGMTIVIISHAAEEMATYADRVAVLSQGRLIKVGTPQEVYGDVESLSYYCLRPPQIAEAFGQLPEFPYPIPVTLEAGKSALRSFLELKKPVSYSLKNTYPPDEAAPILRIQNLQYIYPNGTQALNNISLDIHAGEYVLFVGQNGAGKSTLVKHFLNLLEPTQGQVLVRQRPVQELSIGKLARFIGYVAQNPDNQIFNSTVFQEVAFALRYLNYSPRLIEESVTKSLQDLKLWEHRDAHPLSLPKGERARIIIAAILAMNPEIIILDEPTTGQDFAGACAILEISRKLHRMGKTVIVITHHLYLMPDYAERVIVMGKGNILLDAPTRQAYHKADLLESTYLSPPQVVWLSRYLSNLTQEDYSLLTAAEFASCFKPIN
ncbi:MAG: ATP-binding cassette domain-containing protein [Chloroflexaceae bacterium]|nr:ATP-binding cassette domain-containing protein [Chloroflexaceae bacterium]